MLYEYDIHTIDTMQCIMYPESYNTQLKVSFDRKTSTIFFSIHFLTNSCSL